MKKLFILLSVTTSCVVTTNAFSGELSKKLNAAEDNKKIAEHSDQSTDAKSIISALANKLAKDGSKDLPEWAKQIEIEGDIASAGKGEASILKVTPITKFNNDEGVVFNQTRVAYGRGGRTTVNTGFGVRQLLTNDSFVGLNTFYDQEFPYGHKRMSVGGELRSSAFELNTNYYHALSGWRDADSIYEERALDGYDLELGAQVPYLPWAWGFVKGYTYDSTITKDAKGVETSLRLRPVDNVEVTLGNNNGNSSVQDSNFIEARYRVGFNEPKTQKKSGWISSKPFEYDGEMKAKMLEKVRRSNTITVDRRAKAGTGGGTASVVISRGI